MKSSKFFILTNALFLLLFGQCDKRIIYGKILTKETDSTIVQYLIKEEKAVKISGKFYFFIYGCLSIKNKTDVVYYYNLKNYYIMVGNEKCPVYINSIASHVYKDEKLNSFEECRIEVYWVFSGERFVKEQINIP
jgi:hypothetical protein